MKLISLIVLSVSIGIASIIPTLSLAREKAQKPNRTVVFDADKSKGPAEVRFSQPVPKGKIKAKSAFSKVKKEEDKKTTEKPATGTSADENSSEEEEPSQDQ